MGMDQESGKEVRILRVKPPPGIAGIFPTPASVYGGIGNEARAASGVPVNGVCEGRMR